MHRQIALSLFLLFVLVVGGCSDSTEPVPTGPTALLVAPNTAAPGALIRVSGVDPAAIDMANLNLTIGGQYAIVQADGDGLIAAVPLFLNPAKVALQLPTGALDVQLWAGTELIGEAPGALTLEALPAAPGAVTSVSNDLESIVSSLRQFTTALEGEPSLVDGYVNSWIESLDELFVPGHEYSLPTALDAMAHDNPEALALLEGVFTASGLTEQTEQLAGYAAALAAQAEQLQQQRANKTTELQDYQLALRMQFYVVMRDFGADVIAETNQTWGATVGMVGGIVGISGLAIPGVSIVSAVLSLADFAINKVALGYFPAHINSFEIHLLETLIPPGEVPDLELWLEARNAPPAIGIQDFIDLLLLGLAQGGGDPSLANTFREYLTNTADWYLGIVRSAMAAYGGAHPELQMDIDVGSIPAMVWRAQVTSDRYVTLGTTTPDIINPVDGILAWRAEIDGGGEGLIFARPAIGPEVTSLPMPPGYEYHAGAFGDDLLQTPTESIYVGNALELEVTMSPTISAGGLNGLGVRAGYRDPVGNVTWSQDILVEFEAVGGTVEDASGLTDAEGRFDTFVALGAGFNTVSVTVTAIGDFDVQETRTVSASAIEVFQVTSRDSRVSTEVKTAFWNHASGIAVDFDTYQEDYLLCDPVDDEEECPLDLSPVNINDSYDAEAAYQSHTGSALGTVVHNESVVSTDTGLTYTVQTQQSASVQLLGGVYEAGSMALASTYSTTSAYLSFRTGVPLQYELTVTGGHSVGSFGGITWGPGDGDITMSGTLDAGNHGVSLRSTLSTRLFQEQGEEPLETSQSMNRQGALTLRVFPAPNSLHSGTTDWAEHLSAQPPSRRRPGAAPNRGWEYPKRPGSRGGPSF